MTPEELTFFANQAMVFVLMLSMPALLVATLVGLLVGLLQGLTQIQDQSIPYAVKVVAVIATLALTAQWIGVELHSFTIKVFEQIAFVM